jgi:hypothetical protein
MAKRQAVIKSQQKPRRFPWLPLVLLVASVYAFWIFPNQRGEYKVDVQFDSASR